MVTRMEKDIENLSFNSQLFSIFLQMLFFISGIQLILNHILDSIL